MHNYKNIQVHTDTYAQLQKCIHTHIYMDYGYAYGVETHLDAALHSVCINEILHSICMGYIHRKKQSFA
jgi:hypothetical protein